MEIKLFSTSQPLNLSVKGTPTQVYKGSIWVNNLANRVSADSVSSIIGPDLWGKQTHILAPKFNRDFEGVAVGIAGNASNAKVEDSLRHTPLKDITFYCTIDDKENFEESNCDPRKTYLVLLHGTPWEAMSNLYLGYWPTIAVLYHGQEVLYLNILSDEARKTFKDMGTGYHHWTLANIATRKIADNIQVVTDKVSQSQKVNHLLDCPVSENGNSVDFLFDRSGDHPKIAKETKAFFTPSRHHLLR